MYRQAFTAAAFALMMGVATDLIAQTTPGPAPAPASSRLSRGYFNVNAGFESTSGEFSSASTFRLYDEDGSLSATQAVDSGALFDVAAGARVWRNVTVGLAYHREATTGEGAASASVPNPLVFNRNRSVALSFSDLKRTEQAVHLQLGYMLPLTDRLDVHVTLGPSFFSLKQDVVSELAFAETAFPFTAVNATAALAERSESATGFNAGADVSYLFFDTDQFRLGAGMFIRYAGATVDINLLNNSNSTVGTDVGGLQIGFGARLRF